MRRSFDGLARMTTEIVRMDPLSGHLFIFRNKRGDRLKILWWDRDGYALFYKRLEKGTYQFPACPAPDEAANPEHAGVEIDQALLAMILGGIDTSRIARRARFELTESHRTKCVHAMTT